MGKSILLFIYILLTVSCVHPNIPSNIIGNVSVSIPSVDSEEPGTSMTAEPNTGYDAYTSYDCLMDKSDEFVGVTERGGNNKDFTNRELKRMLVDAGWESGHAWCSYILKGLLDHCDVPNKVTGWSPTSYNKKDVIYTDGRFKQNHKDDDVLVMSLSYAKFKNNRARYKGIGHTGVIKEVRDKSVVTYEGNTGDDGGRDGDGFYKKIRPLTKNLHITRHGIKN